MPKTPKTETEKAFQGKHIRDKKLWIGPEYFGCCGTGRQARLVCTRGTVFVGTGDQFGFSEILLTTEDKAKARRKFLSLARKTEEFNATAREEVQEAKRKGGVESLLTLSDHGVL